MGAVLACSSSPPGGPTPVADTGPADLGVEVGVDAVTPPDMGPGIDVAADVATPPDAAADAATPLDAEVADAGAEAGAADVAVDRSADAAPEAAGPECVASLDCDYPHAMAACMAGRCMITGCAAGYGNCNGARDDGCEVDTTLTAANCGACGTACAAGETCAAGRCESRGRPVELTTGTTLSCARMDTGAVWCWGDNTYGQLGDGTTTARTTPVRVVGLTDAVQITAGAYHVCARRMTGAVSCWGQNSSGQLGRTGAPTRPGDITSFSDATRISAGQTHTCALRATGRIACWGENSFGQLGDGTMTRRNEPVTATGVTGATGVMTGFGFTCALLGSSAQCWGRNGFGTLGDGTMTDRSTAGAVTGLPSTSMFVDGDGARQACLLSAAGAVSCWGYNGDGELGQPAGMSNITSAVALPGATDVAQVTVGTGFTCVRATGGAVRCLGTSRYGQLGDGTVSPAPRRTLAPVTGLTDAVELSSADYHACAIRTSGQVVCWGDNQNGRLGDGTTETRSVPTPVVGLPML